MYGRSHEKGFALLLSLIVVSVIVVVGLSILDLSIKQVRLSTSAKDSEKAFHAANAGMECARFTRRDLSDDMENGNAISPTCFGTTVSATINATAPTVSGDGDANLYTYSFDWGADPRCTLIDTLVASSSVSGGGMTVTNMNALFLGYKGGPTYGCDAGARCTVISVRGYNRNCADISGYGTVEREVLLKL